MDGGWCKQYFLQSVKWNFRVVPMARSLPPLNAVRAFEAAGRHRGFARAAEELSITAAAVGQHVRRLEERLGARLFRRHGRGVVLTAAGRAYLEALTPALERIEAATERVVQAERTGIVTVSTTPSFAAKWLVPRLAGFQVRHPEIDVRLSTSNALADPAVEDVDVAVRYGPGRWPGLEVHPLMETELFPVCSPALLEGASPLREPADLRHHTVLHLMADDWPRWFAAAGVPELAAVAERGPRFSDAGLLTAAAVAGQGVALGQRVLVADDLAAGRLIAPFSVTLASTHAYYLVCAPGELERPKVSAFAAWIHGEAGGVFTGR